MLYAIIARDNPNSLEQRQAVRPQHLARLNELQNLGRLVIAGPHPAIDSDTPGSSGFSGSLIVAQFGSLQEAQQWADDDPYVESGAFVEVIVKPFIQVLP